MCMCVLVGGAIWVVGVSEFGDRVIWFGWVVGASECVIVVCVWVSRYCA